MKIVFSTPGSTTGPQILAQNNTIAASTTTFTTKINGADATNSMTGNQQVEVYFLIPANTVHPNTKMNIELRPSVGAALPFSKTAPPTIDATNVLY
jgi:archaellin